MLRHLNHNTGGKVVGNRETWSGIRIDFYENFLTCLWDFWVAKAHFLRFSYLMFDNFCGNLKNFLKEIPKDTPIPSILPI
jgi:hypothetical protein